MPIQSLLLLMGLTAATGQQVIDSFEPPDSTTARQVWVSSSGTPAVDVVAEGGRPVIELQAPFADDEKLSRAVIDRSVSLDLTAPTRFTLDVAAGRPEAVGEVTLYFRSGSGWYTSGRRLTKPGRQTLTYRKSSFRVEGTPAGWHAVDAVRIAVWRGEPVDSSIRLLRLAAHWEPVAVIVPSAKTHGSQSEFDGARDTADRVAEMLADVGVGADLIEDTALDHNALGDRPLAVLAYHPYLTDEAAAQVEEFVAGGGKLIACYTVPPRLEAVLGLGRLQHVKQTHTGQFAQIRFDRSDVAGLPDSVGQASWNLNVPQTLREDARVIGRWYDSEGNPTGQPAVLLANTGAFVTHILLGDDAAAKREMLAAIVGHLAPPLWPQMATSELARAGRVGHCDSFAQVEEYVAAGGNADAIESLRQAAAINDAARRELSQQRYPEAIRAARQAHELATAAYLRAAPCPAVEGRAFWNHSGTGAHPGDWRRTARELAAAGFNIVLPNMLWGGVAHYPSDVLPRSGTYREYGDQVAQCVEACHDHGIEVHVWKVNWNLSGAPREFVERMRSQGRTQVSDSGKPLDWLCPSHPENLAMELESMLEVARRYPIDGLHFDYIRYPDRSSCYCDGCRDRFEAHSGLRVADWPADCRSGSLAESYNAWRRGQITRLVAAVKAGAKRLRPELKISAAVFGSYPACRDSVAQDWPAWVAEGYLDFVCPMDYTESDDAFVNLVANQLKLVDGRIPIYPGIGATASRVTLSADRVVGQIHHARQLGAAGFTVFNLTAATAGEILPGIALGAGSSHSVPPHGVQARRLNE